MADHVILAKCATRGASIVSGSCVRVGCAWAFVFFPLTKVNVFVVMATQRPNAHTNMKTLGNFECWLPSLAVVPYEDLIRGLQDAEATASPTVNTDPTRDACYLRARASSQHRGAQVCEPVD